MMMPNGNACTNRVKAVIDIAEKLGYKNVIIGLANECNSDILKTFENYGNIDFYAKKYPRTAIEMSKRLFETGDLIKVIESYEGEKIIIFVEYESFAMARMIKYCKKYNIKCVADCEEWYEKSSLFFPANLAKDYDTYYRTEKLHYKIKNIIAISHRFLNKYDNNNRNIVYLPVFVVKNDPKWALKDSKFAKDIVYVGNPGVNNSKERLDIVVEAFHNTLSQSNNYKLKIVGIDNEFYEKNLKIADSNIEVLGKKSHEECLEILKNSCFSLIPREATRKNNYGFPTKLSESLACGTPVITTDISDVANFINNGKNGYLVNECTVDGFSDIFKIIDTLTDEDINEMKIKAKCDNLLISENYKEDFKKFLENLK